ncbi:MAG: metallophosphoesterase family protein [Cyanobacteria bacterium SBLK]|nr:metallophosphoesterase family protein [Cyanobacteria bacterium SBLK]
MKILILSDLHLEFQDLRIPDTDADIIILAGDIHIGCRGLLWAVREVTDRPVLYILGNHEYYTQAYPKLIERLKKIATRTNVSILENDLFIFNDVTFLGCTLWTNFRLFGDPISAGYRATQKMNDYRKIRVSPQYSRLRSRDTAMIHQKSFAWLQANFTRIATSKTVAITHHAPSKKSIPSRDLQNLLTAAYASDLDEAIVKSNVNLWVHGHLHHSVDYYIGNTRIISNPRGYPQKFNPKFDPGLIVEI